VGITLNRLFDTKTHSYEKIQTKSSSLSVHNEDDGRKITINNKHQLIG